MGRLLHYFRLSVNSKRAFGVFLDSDRNFINATTSGDNEMFTSRDGDGSVYYRTGDLLVDLDLTLKTEGAMLAQRWLIVRTSASIGLGVLVPISGPTQLAFLSSGQWAEVAFNGTDWVLVATGSGV